MIEIKVEELSKKEEEILEKDKELLKKSQQINLKIMEFNRKEKDLKKKEEEILMRFDQYNNINMATTDPNLTTVPKQRRYTFSVEHFSNDISVNHKVSVKASSFDDLQKKNCERNGCSK